MKLVRTQVLETEYRLARFYLNRLRIAETTVSHGKSSASYGFSLFDQEWDQIRQWQAWSAQSHSTTEQRRLAVDFPLLGTNLLMVRQSPHERVTWLEAGLQALDKGTRSEKRYAILFYLSLGYRKLGDLDRAEQAAEQLLSLTKGSNSLNTARALCALGYVREDRGAIQEAHQYYHQSAHLFRSSGALSDLIEVNRHLGLTVRLMNSPQAALEVHRENLQIAEKLGQPHLVCRALEGMASGLVNIGDYTDDYSAANDYAERCAAMCRAMGYRELLCSALFVLGRIRVEYKQYEAAVAIFREALATAQEIGLVAPTIHAQYVLGFIALETGNYDDALSHTQKSLALARQHGQLRRIEAAQEVIRWVYLSTNNLISAREELMEGLRLVRQLNTKHHKLRIVADAAIYAHKTGHTHQAAVWAGVVIDYLGELSDLMVLPLLSALETVLGISDYQSALDVGRARDLDSVVDEVESFVNGSA